MNNSLVGFPEIGKIKKRVIIILSIIFSLLTLSMTNTFPVMYEVLLKNGSKIPVITEVAYQLTPFYKYVAALISLPAVILVSLGEIKQQSRRRVVIGVYIYFCFSSALFLAIITSFYLPIFVMG